MEILRPDAHAATLADVRLDVLRGLGADTVIVDLDNTACGYGSAELAPGVAAWVGRAQTDGFRLILLSNNFTGRVGAVAACLGIPAVANALKPLPFGYLRAVRTLGASRRTTVVIGDQLFTDVLGAKLLGMRTVLTHPLVARDFPLTRVLRFLERTLAGRRAP